jgi:CHAT domain-containing protein
MPTTPNGDELPYAADEVNTISALLPRSVKSTVLWHPTKSQVMETIELSSIAHFACHGVVDGDPSKSRMLFLDWETNPFSVVDVS